MGKLKLLTVAVMSLTLTFTPTVQSNAKTCSATDRTNIDQLALAHLYATVYTTEPKRYGTLTKRLDTAIKATKSTKLKTQLVKLKREIFTEYVENGEILTIGRTSDIIFEIQDMKKYSLC